MTDIQVGDTVRRRSNNGNNASYAVGTDPFTVVGTYHDRWTDSEYLLDPYDGKHSADSLELVDEVTVNVPFETALRSVLDATDPNHYKFPGGAEVRHISEWLTANAAQALQYIARSSRIDGQNKGDAREDLLKARKFIDFELERLDV